MLKSPWYLLMCSLCVFLHQWVKKRESWTLVHSRESSRPERVILVVLKRTRETRPTQVSFNLSDNYPASHYTMTLSFLYFKQFVNTLLERYLPKPTESGYSWRFILARNEWTLYLPFRKCIDLLDILDAFFILVNYLSYGPYSSFAPSYDSSFSNITKEDTDLLLATYGDETGLQYALRYVKWSLGCKSFNLLTEAFVREAIKQKNFYQLFTIVYTLIYVILKKYTREVYIKNVLCIKSQRCCSFMHQSQIHGSFCHKAIRREVLLY